MAKQNLKAKLTRRSSFCPGDPYTASVYLEVVEGPKSTMHRTVQLEMSLDELIRLKTTVDEELDRARTHSPELMERLTIPNIRPKAARDRSINLDKYLARHNDVVPKPDDIGFWRFEIVLKDESVITPTYNRHFYKDACALVHEYLVNNDAESATLLP